MSVIVNGMKMPGTCVDCPLFRESAYGFDFCKGKGIGFVAEDAKWLDATRVNWCPLVELPEKHGDLVDISQEVNIEYFDDMNQEWSLKAGTVAEALSVCEEFPETIVESEGDD